VLLACTSLSTALLLTPGSAIAQAVDAGTASGNDDVINLDQVVVTASGFEQTLKNAPASISVITREELERGSFRDLTDALREVQGVAVTGVANEKDIFIRGLPGTYTLILVDGKRQSTRDARTNEEIGLALEKYLRELPYTYEVAPLSTNSDAVDQFLFDMRQGYCTYYASAFAVLARSLGVPARLAVGYNSGIYDPDSQTYTVYEGDAHAWPELYIAGRWVVFEPTPIMPLPARDSQPQRPQPHVIEALPEQAPFSATSLRDYWPGLLLILGLLVAISAPWWPRLRPDYSPDAIQRQFERRGRRIGVIWPEGATISEYAAQLKPSTFQASRSLQTLVELLERARYSQRELTREELSRLLNAWTVVRDHVLQPKK